MRGKGTGRIRSSRQNRKRRVRIRRNGHESLSSLRIQNPVLGGRIASAESSGVDRVLQDCTGSVLNVLLGLGRDPAAWRLSGGHGSIPQCPGEACRELNGSENARSRCPFVKDKSFKSHRPIREEQGTHTRETRPVRAVPLPATHSTSPRVG